MQYPLTTRQQRERRVLEVIHGFSKCCDYDVSIEMNSNHIYIYFRDYPASKYEMSNIKGVWVSYSIDTEEEFNYKIQQLAKLLLMELDLRDWNNKQWEEEDHE